MCVFVKGARSEKSIFVHDMLFQKFLFQLFLFNQFSFFIFFELRSTTSITYCVNKETRPMQKLIIGDQKEVVYDIYSHIYLYQLKLDLKNCTERSYFCKAQIIFLETLFSKTYELEKLQKIYLTLTEQEIFLKIHLVEATIALSVIWKCCLIVGK